MDTELMPINIFDFDGTLTTDTWPKFWVWVKKFGFNGEKRNDELEVALAQYRKLNTGNELETFFGFFNDLLKNNNEVITIEELMNGEKFIKYNPGVVDFLKTTDAKNYIVSGGIKDFLDHLKVSNYFEDIYGTSLVYSQNNICGIGEIMSDNSKILAIKDILKKNKRKNNDCRNVYYIGDGYSDYAAMEFVHNNGGKAIFVHQPNQDDELYQQNFLIYEALNKNGIVDFCAVADYSEGSPLDSILKR